MRAIPPPRPLWAWPVVALLLWLPALAGPFQFDDYNVIVRQTAVHSLAAWWDSLPGIRPLLKLSYALNWSLSPAPFGFHLVNLCLHSLNGLLLHLWLSRLPLPATAPRLAITLLWLLHPAQTEAVTYIAGRSVLLSTTGLLAGLWWLAGSHPRRGLAAAACTLAALAVRETAWIFPLAFALVEWLRGRSARAIWDSTRLSWLVVAALACLFLIEPHFRRLIDVSFATRGAGEQILSQTEAYRYFVTGPLRLVPNIDPDLPSRPLPQWHHLIWGAGWLATAVAAVWGVACRRSWLAGGVLWSLLLLWPTNGIMPRLDVASDRHLYPALIGLAWTIGLLLQSRYLRPVLWMLVPLLAVALLIRNEDYRSEVALWSRTAEQSPGKSRVWNNLGVACLQADDIRCARAAFDRALRLDPDNQRAAVNRYFLDHPVHGHP
jgi:hypothetical protein